MNPIDVPVHHSHTNGIYFASLFRKAEAEYVAVAIVRTLGRLNRGWEAVTFDEVLPELKTCPAIRAGIIDPVLGVHALKKQGLVIIDTAAKTITPTPSFVIALTERFSA